MVSSYKINELLSFLENIDLIIAEGWLILMKQPCVIDHSGSLLGEIVLATMELQGERTYFMNIWTSYELAKELATEFYGGEMELDQEMIIETIGEFLNIIAGNLQGILAKNATLSPPKAQKTEGLTQSINGIVRHYKTPSGSFIFSIH